MFLQVAIYCGVPAGVDSFRIAREAFAEIDKRTRRRRKTITTKAAKSGQ